MPSPESVKSLLRRRGSFVGSITSTTSPYVTLTLDDGPDPDQTPRALEVLRGHQATGTFFVLLSRVRKYPQLMAEVVDAGHEVGLHGVDHRPLTDFPYRVALRRTREAKHELEAVVGQPVRWFRPPYGSQSPVTWAATRRAGLTPVLWSATTWDWKDVAHEDRIARAMQGARAGSILLAHDGIAGVEDGAAPGEPPLADRMDLLDEVMAGYLQHGLQCSSLREALRHGDAVRTMEFSLGTSGRRARSGT